MKYFAKYGQIDSFAQKTQTGTSDLILYFSSTSLS